MKAYDPDQAIEGDERLERVDIDLLAASRITLRDIEEHLTGPVVSIIIHIIFLSLLATMVVREAPPDEDRDIVVEQVELVPKTVEKIIELVEPKDNPVDDDIVIDMEIDAPDVNDDSTPDVSVGDMDVSDVAFDVPPTNLNLNLAPTASALKIASLPPSFAGRTTKGRKKALRDHDGSIDSELAVVKALDWLVERQNTDGSWGYFQQTRPAFTALALLCFLGHGENPCSVKYGPTVIKAIKRLLALMEDMRKHHRECVGTGETYNHALVAYALSEAYGITRMPRVRDAMDAAVSVLVSGMNDAGGYWYGYERRLGWPAPSRDPVTGKYPSDDKRYNRWPRSSLSFAGWNYQALKAAFAAGCDVDGLEEAIHKGVEGIKRHFKNGGFGNRAFEPGHVDAPDFAMTSVGALCLGLLGDGNCQEAKSAWRWLRQYNKKGLRECSWRWNPKIHKSFPKAFTFALYTWYYQTQLLFQVTKGEGPNWKRWNRSFASAYCVEQADDGHWSSPAQKYGLTGEDKLDPKKHVAEWTFVRQFADERDLNIYATTMCCLGLEIYYRYLPTYELISSAAIARVETINDDDLGVLVE